jgi:DNA polymerase-1
LRHLYYKIKRSEVRINVVECVADLAEFRRFVGENPVMGFDTETTGLDWWNADRGFRIRLAQFGNAVESFVLPVELGREFWEAAIWGMRQAQRLIAHNGIYDQHVVEACGGPALEELAPKMIDTKICAHLVDPRAVKERGPGLKLEELTKFYIDAQVAEEVKGSAALVARKYKSTKEKFWPIVELFDEDYLLYAGMDPILAFRLFHVLWPLVPARSKRRGLFSWEHRVNHVTGKLERQGYLLDAPYAESQVMALGIEAGKWTEVARGFGVENLNSNAQLIDAFQSFGITLTKRTAKNNLAMDDDVLTSISHPLAEAVIKARKAQKWSSTWFERALNGRDSAGRVHASVNSIQARTARMSITGSVPAQTFPATPYVRHMFLADEGHVSVSIDFGNMELRDLAAESKDPTMLHAFANEMDLHQITADAAQVPRKVGKMGNFLTVYGGGWKALMEQAGVSEEIARRTLKGFNEAYPEVGVFSKKLAAEARRTGYVFTPTGRRLPVDRGREYAALNYYIQSGSRDITVRALLQLDKAGFSPYMRLPIHDEIVFSFPKEQAKEMTREAARLMEFTVKGMLIPADGEIGDRSWGSVLELEESKH